MQELDLQPVVTGTVKNHLYKETRKNNMLTVSKKLVDKKDMFLQWEDILTRLSF